jgi:hypothetical protein
MSTDFIRVSGVVLATPEQINAALPDDAPDSRLEILLEPEPGTCPVGETLPEAVEVLSDGSRTGHSGTSR